MLRHFVLVAAVAITSIAAFAAIPATSLAAPPPPMLTVTATDTTSATAGWTGLAVGATRVDLEYWVAGDPHHMTLGLAVPSDPGSIAISGLEAGKQYYFKIRAVDSSGPGEWSNEHLVPLQMTPPSVTLDSVPGPATSSQTPSFSFTTSSGSATPSSVACSIDGGPPVACTSPFTPGTLADYATHKFTVTVSNAAGSDSTSTTTWVDTRSYTLATTLLQSANSLTSTGQVSSPVAHPNVSLALNTTGAMDTVSGSFVLPHGLNVSFQSIPDPGNDSASTRRRCSISEAAAANCPDSSIIGTSSAQLGFTDSWVPVVATGKVFMTDPRDPDHPAGFAIVESDTGGRGSVVIQGDIDWINNLSNIRLTMADIPTSTSIGFPFHLSALTMSLNGDAGGSSAPLITSPSYCGTPSTGVGFGPFFPATPSNPTGYTGPFNRVVSNVTSSNALTATSTVNYPVSGCSTTVAPFNPTFSQTLYDPTIPGAAIAGSAADMIATVTLPMNSSGIKSIFAKEPPKIGTNFPAFGDPTDQCPASSAPYATSGVGTTIWEPSTCPPQAVIGQAVITSPLLDKSGIQGNKQGTGDGQLIADVYLINRGWPAWLGIHIDGSVTYPNRGVNANGKPLANPQGVTANIVATSSTGIIHTACHSFNGDPDCGVGMPGCDLDTQGFCQTQITVNIPIVPDLPILTETLRLGQMADGSDLPASRIAGGIQSNEPVTVISSGDNTCASGIDPNTPGADTGGGSPFTQSATSMFAGWSRTASNGAPGVQVTKSSIQTTPGC